jgi:hypothetical protein
MGETHMRFLVGKHTVSALALLLLIPRGEYGRAGLPQESGRQQQPIVIVELFTSEGCSSCPPADELVKRISEQQLVPGVAVVALEQHVDYWNHDGWYDPFSSVDFTSRQVAYSRVLPKSGVYTPQIVVDGSVEITGNRGQQLDAAIRQAALVPKATVMLIPSAEKTPGKASFEVKVDHLPPIPAGDELEFWVAVTEKGLQSNVKAGENSGEILRHAAVVRSLQKAGTTKNGAGYSKQVTVKLEKNWKLENLAVVAFVVDKKSFKVVGAATARVT